MMQTATETRFSPTVTVMSDQPPVLRPPDLSLDALAARFPGLHDASAAAVTGSTAVGWANLYSDVDIYTFSDRPLDLPDDPSVELWPGEDASGVSWLTWMGRYGDARVDLKVLPLDAAATVLEPYVDGRDPEFCDATEFAQDFIYRLSVALPLTNAAFWTGLADEIRRSSYARSMARVRKVDAENRLTDVAGQLDAGDVLSARMAAFWAAVFATDCRLLAAGELCRGDKWLLRRLDETPACGIGSQEFLDEVLAGPRAGETPAACAERVARWAQRQLRDAEPEILA
jgi:hypothetical protein